MINACVYVFHFSVFLYFERSVKGCTVMGLGVGCHHVLGDREVSDV